MTADEDNVDVWTQATAATDRSGPVAPRRITALSAEETSLGSPLYPQPKAGTK